MQQRVYDAPHLARNPANHAALTPLGFLERAAAVYPDKIAVIHGDRRLTYREFYERCRRFADALRRRGVAPGDTVSVLAPKTLDSEAWTKAFFVNGVEWSRRNRPADFFVFLCASGGVCGWVGATPGEAVER